MLKLLNQFGFLGNPKKSFGIGITVWGHLARAGFLQPRDPR
jgi:hypothetical protein